MTAPLKTLLEQALALSTDERAQLAQQLLESLREADFENDALQSEWEEEIARRLADLRSGAVTLSSWGDLRSELIEAERTSGG